MNDGLTPKQRKFVEFYLGESKGNATDAARRAGYKGGDNVLGVTGAENLKNPKIRAYIDDRLLAESLSAAEVLHELTDLARSEWREHLEIKIDPKTGDVVYVRMDLSAKVKSLELLGKYHKLFTDKTEGSSTVLVREYADG